MRYFIESQVNNKYTNVYRCRDTVGTTYACKVITHTHDDVLSHHRLFTEIICLQNIHHPNVVRLYDEIGLRRLEITGEFHHIDGMADDTGLVMDMWDDVVRIVHRDEKEVAYIIREILRATVACHDAGYIHKDIKPSNMLISDCKRHVALCDFGMAMSYKGHGSMRMDMVEGTVCYIPPEILRKECMPSSDVWSIGVSTYQLLKLAVPFGANETRISRVWRSILNDRVDYIHTASEEANDFIQRCLIRDPLERPSALEMLEHPWLLNV